MPWVSLVARLVLGLLFLISGLNKILSPVQALQAVQAFQILPGGLAEFWAYGQPGLEIALGVLLVAGLGTRLVAILSAALLLIFIGGIASVWARGISIDCGCFSGGGAVSSGQAQYPLALLRDAGLLVLAAVVVAWPPGKAAVDRPPGAAARAGHAGWARHTWAPIMSGIVLAAIMLAVVVSAVVQGDRTASAAPAAYQGPYAPVTVDLTRDTVTMTQPGVTGPVVNVYEDFQCPICQEFERANGGVLQQLAYRGQVRVVYHPFTIFLGVQPGQANSTRAWAAAKCAPAGSWLRYHNLLYVHQPVETTAGGFPVRQLLALGKDAGLTGPAFTRCVSSQLYAPQIVRLSKQLGREGINATPTVSLNGRSISTGTLVTPGIALRQMILSAR